MSEGQQDARYAAGSGSAPTCNQITDNRIRRKKRDVHVHDNTEIDVVLGKI